MATLIAMILAGTIVALVSIAVALKHLLDSWTHGVDLALRDIENQEKLVHSLRNLAQKAAKGGTPWKSLQSPSSESYYLPLQPSKNTKSEDSSNVGITHMRPNKLPPRSSSH